MSLDEMISIERVEFQTTKERIQETYVIADLTLSKLFEEIFNDLERDILPLLNIEIFLKVIESVPFTDESIGICISEGIRGCVESQRYGKSLEWNCKIIVTKLNRLRNLILYDYSIEGSLTLSYTGKIGWDLVVSFL
ncbi:MAG: hypothetical protein ACXAAH_04280 [Promethearchaeota archaeon]